MSSKNPFKSISYFIKLGIPYLRHGVSYIRFFRYVSSLKRRGGVQFGTVQGTNATYQFDVRDLVIPSYIFTRRKTYAQEDIELFFRFTQEKCGIAPKEGLFLDIGANIGTTTVHVAKNMGDGLRVIAFEPDRLNFQLLTANCEQNGCRNVSLCNTALSNQSGVMELQVFDYNRGKCKLVTDGSAEKQKADKSKTMQTETVPIISLDAYLRENEIPGDQIHYIWIDVEGHESCVIDGMMELLTAYHPPMLMEFTPKGVPCMDVDDDDFAILYENLSRVYKNMIVWPINNQRHTAEFPVTHLKRLFDEETQQYNLFLY